MKRKSPTLALTRGAMIAALYLVLTLLSSLVGLDRGIIQFRLSEMLCVLPIFFPEAVIGLSVGCFISNLIFSGVIWDVLFGTLATLIGAVGAYLLAHLSEKLYFLVPLPTIISNALIIPFVLKYAYGFTGGFWLFVMTVGLGEIASAGVLGVFTIYLFKKINKRMNI